MPDYTIGDGGAPEDIDRGSFDVARSGDRVSITMNVATFAALHGAVLSALQSIDKNATVDEGYPSPLSASDTLGALEIAMFRTR